MTVMLARRLGGKLVVPEDRRGLGIRFATAAAFALMGVLAACATRWDIDKYEAPEANFPARHTYAWKPGQFSTPVPQSASDVQRLDQAVRAAVEEELARKGYKQV